MHNNARINQDFKHYKSLYPERLLVKGGGSVVAASRGENASQADRRFRQPRLRRR